MVYAAGQVGLGGRRWPGAIAALVAVLALLAWPACAQVLLKDDPEDLKGVDLVQKLSAQVPLDVEIIDSKGKTVKLGQYFNQGKPVVLAMVYFDCPMICPLVLTRLQERLNGLSYIAGEDFNVVIISFDPKNTTEMAAQNKEAYLTGYNHKRNAIIDAGWEFHTAAPGNARAIAESIGFKYRYIEATGQYAHPAVLTVLTDKGQVSSYLSGLDSDSAALKLALLEASKGKIAKNIGEFFLHRCYRYDPKTGAYSIKVTRIMQMGGLLTVTALGALLAGLRAHERAKAHRAAAPTTDATTTAPGAPARGTAMGQTP